MRKLKTAFYVGFALAIIFSFLFIYTRGKSEPRLKLKYLAETNIAGVRIAQFAVTNVGNAPAIAFNLDEVEFLQNGLETRQIAGCSRALHRLRPGIGDVLDVPLIPGYSGLWRLHCLYAHEGMRSWYCDLKSKGLSWVSVFDYFLPSRFKVVRMDVEATSEWIYELNTH